MQVISEKFCFQALLYLVYDLEIAEKVLLYSSKSSASLESIVELLVVSTKVNWAKFFEFYLVSILCNIFRKICTSISSHKWILDVFLTKQQDLC